ncbi:hypothetical protein [Serratia fonticola]|uniref:hypothetical protein n=1 Tax=Serratia fonticola TaxID=47917 RepID=UPI00192D101C|nr:hypothetical protein [Serratia fonticola]MBL5829158.1 hypothetical protein [Serratia fonticola]
MRNHNQFITKFINFINENMSATAFFIVLIIAAPFVFYFYNFHAGFSKIPADWGAFGSFVGGVAGILAPLLTLVTVLILIRTLDESKKSYKLIERKENIEIVRNLVNELEASLKKGLYCQLTNRVVKLDSLCDECNQFVITALLAHEEGEQENELEEFSYLATMEYSSFEVLDGLSLFIEIVEIIRMSDDEGSNYTSMLKSIFMTRFHSTQRYWLYYLLDRSLYQDTIDYLFLGWEGFQVPPSILLNARDTN